MKTTSAPSSLLLLPLLLFSFSTSPSQAAPPPEFPDLAWWMYPGTNMRTVSLTCADPYSDFGGFQGLMKQVDQLCLTNVNVININVVYDPGTCYTPWHLWCGLAGGNYTALNPMFGGTDAERRDNFEMFKAKTRKCGMKIVSWLNPSYIWDGSEYWQLAKQDYRSVGGDISQLPFNSPARWFEYGGDADTNCVAPDQCFPEYIDEQTKGYVIEPEIGTTYLSNWAKMPSVRFLSSAWQAKIQEIIEFYAYDLGIDGVMLDYPDGYVDAGVDSQAYFSPCAATPKNYWTYIPGLLAQTLTLTQIRRNDNFQFAFFGEHYNNPDMAVQYRLSSALTDQNIQGEDFGAYDIVATSIINEDTTDMDYAFACPGCVDSFNAECWYTNFNGEGGWCPVSMERQNPSSDPKDAVVNSLAYVINMAAGYLPAVEALNSGWDYWLYGPWPGSDLLSPQFVSDIQNLRAFNLLSLRAPVYVDDSTSYGLVRYDAFGTGETALFFANVADTAATVTMTDDQFQFFQDIDSNHGSFNDELSGRGAICCGIEVKAKNYELVTGFVQPYVLPAWDVQGWINCYGDGNGASYSPDAAEGGDSTNIAQCLLICLADDMCQAVTVQWQESGLVTCYKRGGVDLSKCAQFGDAAYGDPTLGPAYSTFTLRSLLIQTNPDAPPPPPRQPLFTDVDLNTTMILSSNETDFQFTNGEPQFGTFRANYTVA